MFPELPGAADEAPAGFPAPQPDDDPVVLRNALVLVYNLTLDGSGLSDVVARYKAHCEAAKVLSWPISDKALAASQRESGKEYADSIPA